MLEGLKKRLSRGKTVEKLTYDPAEKQPVIRCSICNGEQVAGLRDRKTGAFEEIMVLRDPEDRLLFEAMAGTDEIEKIY